MFEGCSGLTGNIPKLPDNLESASRMFRNCYGLSGKAPPKPANLTYSTDIFTGTGVTNDGSWSKYGDF
jgi:hypothetical protein